MFSVQSHTNSVILSDGHGQMRIAFVSDSIARVTVTEARDFKQSRSMIIQAASGGVTCDVREARDTIHISTPALVLVVSKTTGEISYHDGQGKLLLCEPVRGGKSLVPKKIFRNIFRSGTHVAASQNVDGARAAATESESVFDRDAYEATLHFQFAADEAIFGLGSHEEGYGNLRGKERLLYQQNMKIVVPVFVSTRGYGVLWDCGSLMTFHDGADGCRWWADAVDELDFYFAGGGSFDSVSKNLHELTGRAPMLPKWAFGFAQSKERYVNAEEMIEVVRDYRRRRIPLDLIVLDWKSWPNGAGWGQKTFDPVRFPNPNAMTEELHSLGAKLMVSIWPIMTGDCPNQRELQERRLMLGNQATYDAFSPEAREIYWRQTNDGLFAKGVDAWWCDCTEPFEADWSGDTKPEPRARLLLNTEAAKKYLDVGQINTYSLPHSQGIYEGQRRATLEKRVLNLTRSGYAGQHRYATVCWNGDVSATWETLRRCIPEGVNFCATGEPFWTVDIGGFFINNDPKLWFWRGDYADGCRGLTDMNALAPDPNDTGCRDLGFWELYTRWLQYAAFLPMFRSHGTDAAREIWRFGDEGTLFYDTIATFIRLRYQLMPYIYSLAAQVTQNGRAMMRAVAFDFPADVETHHLTDAFLFGPAILVCPVTTPMYFANNSQPIVNASKTRGVYLPAGTLWFDFWTDKTYEGGQTIIADAPLEIIPLFVRAGSILPMTEAMQFVDEHRDASYEIRIYRGADGAFTLYEDAGDGYAYEDGAFSLIKLEWDDRQNELTIHERHGTFESMVTRRRLNLVFISGGQRQIVQVTYDGAAMKMHAPESD